MQFRRYNHNYKNRNCNDSNIRALGLATNKDWCTVYKNLSIYAMNKGLVADDKRVFNSYMKFMGYIAHPVPKISNGKCTVKDFAEFFAEKDKTYILKLPHAVTTIKNGDLYDIYDSSSKVVNGYWVIEGRTSI